MKFFSSLILLPFISAQDFSESLNINAYLGKWYQVYSDKFVTSTFEKNAKCISAVYGLYGVNNISVYNEQFNSITGEKESIDGYAYIKDDKYPRKLSVNLNGGMGDAPYWIYETGPIKNNEYQYSIVSDELKLSLFVLVRNVETFMKEYNEHVLEQLEKFGFTKSINQPILTKK